MFDPLIKHYQRLNNIKPSPEIANVFSGSNKRRKRQNSATGYRDQSTVGEKNASFGRPRRPHSSIAFSGNVNSNADNNNNYYRGLQGRRNSSTNLNNTRGPKGSYSWSSLNHGQSNHTQDPLLQKNLPAKVLKLF